MCSWSFHSWGQRESGQDLILRLETLEPWKGRLSSVIIVEVVYHYKVKECLEFAHYTKHRKKIQHWVLIKQRARKNGFSFIRALIILWIYPQSQLPLILLILILVTTSTAGFWTKEYYTMHNETLLQKWRMHPGKVSM